ncbi:MAG TPA: hypothetical protein EYP78_01255 [Candidatus Omnitrophica bacterium]|nr:hypothetical protein [Candidatus Omnitrophota bacterium]
MRKIVGLIIVGGIVFAIWFSYSSSVKNSQRGPQGTPEKTVSNFMLRAEKMSNLIWKQEEREKVRNLLREWQNVKEEDTEKQKEIAEKLEALGIEDPTPLFKDENYAKIAFGVFCLFKFGNYKVEEPKINKNSAQVEVSFSPVDFLGLKATLEGLTGKKSPQRKEPSQILFHLEKRFHKWYITEIGGEEGRLINASYRLRKYR